MYLFPYSGGCIEDDWCKLRDEYKRNWILKPHSSAPFKFKYFRELNFLEEVIKNSTCDQQQSTKTTTVKKILSTPPPLAPPSAPLPTLISIVKQEDFISKKLNASHFKLTNKPITPEEEEEEHNEFIITSDEIEDADDMEEDPDNIFVELTSEDENEGEEKLDTEEQQEKDVKSVMCQAETVEVVELEMEDDQLDEDDVDEDDVQEVNDDVEELTTTEHETVIKKIKMDSEFLESKERKCKCKETICVERAFGELVTATLLKLDGTNRKRVKKAIMEIILDC